jgi:alpha-mannosidase
LKSLFVLVEIKIPEQWEGEEVHLLWSNSSEALVYIDGIPRQSLYGSNGDDQRKEFILTNKALKNENFLLYIEMV